MSERVLPKYSKINVIDKPRKCKFRGEHSLVQKQVQIYNKYKTTSTENVFECSKCKKIFIMKGNKQRFLDSYPLYEIDREKQDKVLTQKQIDALRRKEKLKRKKENEKIARELERIKRNNPEEIRKRKILSIMSENKIKVLNNEHIHNPMIVSCTIGKNSLRLKYCEECNLLYCSREEYDDYIKNGVSKRVFIYNDVEHTNMSIFNIKASDEKNTKKKKNKQKKEQINQTESNKTENEIKKEYKNNQVQKKNIILPKADFFVRANIRSCPKNNHNIVDLLAEVDVICSNGDVIKKSFPASYCEECNLYFMYDKQYKILRKSGVPLCSIYEFSKYIKTTNTGKVDLKPESLLHSFGYNVGASEGLSTKQRNKILSFVIKNGIMSKHEIINLLSYFVDFRKNDKRQVNAVKKWKMDIEYLRNTDIDMNKKVKINSIRVVNIVNKK